MNFQFHIFQCFFLNAVFFILTSFFGIDSLFSQKEFSYWYFGNGAGIKFSNEKVVAITDGQLYTEEGCASISDANGNLLFYTNGVSVWDNHHKPMPNGFGLHGGISATQSAIILPMPDFPYKYYIFTVAEKANAAGLSYSVVDLLAGSDKKIFTKNQRILLTPDIILSSAKPDVVVKNVKLVAPVSEKLIAAKHSNGRDFWIIAHLWNSDAFYVFPVTPEGVGKPIISNIGTVHKETGAGANRESIGCLAVSHDSKKICSAICYKPNNDLEIFDFDNSTGKISNPKKIPTAGFAYGLAFSPDNSKLYVSFLKGDGGILQYDLEDNFKPTLIAKNLNDNGIFGALQKGPDGKIYVSRTGQYLDVIHQPDEKGTLCKYEQNAVFLGGKYAVYGLPAPVLLSSEFAPPKGGGSSEEKKMNAEVKKDDCFGKTPVIPLPSDTNVYCVSEIILDAGNNASNYLWSTGETTHKIKVTESGKYEVTAEKNGCKTSAAILVNFYEKPSTFNYLPEFTPSHGLFNNSFQISINDVSKFELKIFSPKGKLVFETTELKNYWTGKDKKGKDLPAGDYKWEIKYIPKCGEQKVQVKNGKVKMVR